MKIRLENLATFLLISALVLCGYSGCNQVEQAPAPQEAIEQSEEVRETSEPVVETPPTPTPTPITPIKEGDPPSVSTPVETPSVDSNGKPLSKMERIKILNSTPDLSVEERRSRLAAIVVEGLSTIEAADALVGNGLRNKARPYLDKALAENPDDFDVMLLWGEGANKREDETADEWLVKKRQFDNK